LAARAARNCAASSHFGMTLARQPVSRHNASAMPAL
jgi:hypothetical protein